MLRTGVSIRGSGDPVSAAVRPLRSFRRWLWHDKRGALATGYLVLVALVAIFAALIAQHSPVEQDLTAILQGPSRSHWIGTDDLGRDVFARLVYGARASLVASLLAVSVALLIGVPIGLIAGFLGGWTDSVLMRI